jgi:exodeoxyribonuclease VIII
MRTADDLVRDRAIAAPAGTVRQEPLHAYLARTDYVSGSALRRSLHTADRAAALHIADDPSQRLAQALHALVLEPKRFARDYLVLDRGAAAPAGDEAPDARVWLAGAEYAALAAARDAIRGYPRAPLARWLDAGMKELSIYWTDDAGRRWKARPDCFTDGLVLELKTTGDVRPRAFARTRRRFGYDLKAAHYVDAVRHLTGRAPRFAFIAVELSSPHYVWLHELSAAELGRAAVELAAARRRFPLLG